MLIWDSWREFILWLRVPLITALSAALAASVYVFGIASPQWEVRAIVQVGRVAQNPIESPARSAERIRGEQFITAVLAELNVNDRDDARAQIVYRTLRIQQLPNTDLLDLKVRAYDAKEVRLIAETFVRKLAEVHKQIGAPTLERIQTSLAEAERTITRLTEERDAYRHVLKGMEKNQLEQSLTVALSVFQISTLENAIVSALNTRNLLREQLSPSQTFETSTIEPVSVSARPVAPPIALILGFSAVIGFVGGMFCAGPTQSANVRYNNEKNAALQSVDGHRQA